MAQINLTLNEQEVLQVITGDRNEALRFLLERLLNEIMKAESEEQLKAKPHERTEARTDYRNGTRKRPFVTRFGKLELEVPRHRDEPFHTMIFENYKRSEASLIATMVQMVIAGVSTRKVARVVEELCGTSFSKSTVSKLCKKLDEDIKRFQTQPLAGIIAPFLIVDATYFHVREDHRVRSKAFFVALAICSDGKREVVGFDVFDQEENYSWKAFFEDLKQRGLQGIMMTTSDAHPSIRAALAEVYPEAAWQRCQTHLIKNILDATPNKEKEGLKLELRKVFTAKDKKEAEKVKDALKKEYEGIADKAMEVLENGFEDSMTIMALPESIRKYLRTSNLVERLNRELKRRSDVIQIFPDKHSLLRLMGAVTIEYSEAQSAKTRMFSEERYAEMQGEPREKLLETAALQQEYLRAA